ncbi:hypothetical protein M3Y99_01328200 [Aphelenchoides fujianensis]|nr:hypothetical protein M3Y99_01328200 [Aphelenchoides fujianensis]
MDAITDDSTEIPLVNGIHAAAPAPPVEEADEAEAPDGQLVLCAEVRRSFMIALLRHEMLKAERNLPDFGQVFRVLERPLYRIAYVSERFARSLRRELAGSTAFNDAAPDPGRTFFTLAPGFAQHLMPRCVFPTVHIPMGHLDFIPFMHVLELRDFTYKTLNMQLRDLFLERMDAQECSLCTGQLCPQMSAKLFKDPEVAGRITRLCAWAIDLQLPMVVFSRLHTLLLYNRKLEWSFLEFWRKHPHCLPMGTLVFIDPVDVADMNVTSTLTQVVFNGLKSDNRELGDRLRIDEDLPEKFDRFRSFAPNLQQFCVNVMLQVHEQQGSFNLFFLGAFKASAEKLVDAFVSLPPCSIPLRVVVTYSFFAHSTVMDFSKHKMRVLSTFPQLLRRRFKGARRRTYAEGALPLSAQDPIESRSICFARIAFELQNIHFEFNFQTAPSSAVVLT